MPDLRETAWQTCLTMLRQRDYAIESVDAQAGEIIAHDPHKNVVVNVFFIDAPKLNIALAKQYYYRMTVQQLKHCILVYRDGITTTVKTTLASIINVRVELFTYRELQFNVTEHVLVPLHKRVPATAEMETTKFPILKSTDAVARFLGFQANDVVEIHRHDGTLSYRVVRT